ncbi:MAG: DnaJ domain-containing protein [Bacteroidales bacterium]|nr:DnaJ domain-containing protein [Bacteroidales bacterium]MDD4395126.1 DnaJ domain-containing protein [Bacteroidales bacterium]
MFRIIGIILGVIFGGFWGAVAGYFIGSFIDKLVFSKIKIEHHRTYSRSDFSSTLLILSAAVIKADGRFVKSELYYLKDYFIKTMGHARASVAMAEMQEIYQNNYDIPAICTQLRKNSSIHERLLILQFLFGLAAADGEMLNAEILEIQNIAQWAGISQNDFESIKSMFLNNHQYYQQSTNSNGRSSYSSYDSLNNDYKILEISSDATDDEVKKAYRSLAKKHHPDRVSHLGEDMRKAAEEKFAKLNQAYENIKISRGMK